MRKFMKKDQNRVKWNSYREVRRVQKTMFFSWAFSFMIPIVLFTVINLMTYGPHAIDFFKVPDFINRQVYQLNELNSGEYFKKRVENIIIDSPSEEVLYKKFDEILKENNSLPERESFNNRLVVVRKDDAIIRTIILGDSISENDLENFGKLPDDILPKFKPGRATKNEMLFHTTGYVIDAQMDFYFDDGSQGTIFTFQKFTDIPGKVASTIGKNLLYVLVIMFFTHMVLAYYMMKRLTRPVSEIVKATEEVAQGNYEYQIPIRDNDQTFGHQPFLGSISLSINEMIRELDRGKKVQDKIDSMRSEFLANVSHDMKTPLTSIKIHAQAIQDGIVRSPEKMERYLENILMKSNDMDHMLNELKVYNELELGTGNYEMQRVSINNFLEDVTEELAYDVNSNKVTLDLQIDTDDLVVEFDPKKLRRVLSNITFNSVKYAEVRPLTIKYTLSQVLVEGMKWVQLTIEDNGVGVDESEYDKLFIQHYRVDPARNQTIAGSGLGLSIAQSIVEHHDGRIHAQKSNLGGLAIVIRLKI